MKKLVMLFLGLSLLLPLGGCAAKPEETQPIHVGVLKGPTGIGAVVMMDEAQQDENAKYSFELLSEPTDVVAKVVNGELDLAAIPTNLAANLYNKTSGGIQAIALNTLSVLYFLENGNTIQRVSDLKGKTIYTTGQGANPEYVLRFILNENGLTVGEDVEIAFGEANEIAARMAADEISVCMLPVPAATAIPMKNPDVHVVLDVGQEYDRVARDGSTLTMGCIVGTKEFIEKNPQAVSAFLEDYRQSIETVLKDQQRAADLTAQYGITANAAIAKAAIPDCGIVCITGTDLRQALEGYLEVLYRANPASIGQAMPKDDFYYTE